MRLFVTGWTSEGTAVIVKIYAGSNEAARRRHAECLIVTRMEDSGRWYLLERL